MALMKRLGEKCDEVVKAKRPIEQRMVDDIRQYDGTPRIRMSKQDTTSVNRGSLEPPRIHATRSRTDALESRLADMLFPTNDHPWDMTPTPDDEWEMPDESDPSTSQYGQPAPPPAPPQPQGQPQGAPSPDQGVLAQMGGQQSPGAPQPGPPQPAAPDKNALSDAIDEACERMKKTIRDQFNECNFVASGRIMVRDACRYGFGILEGPFVTTKTQRRFNGPQMEMSVREIPIPAIKYCDPWCFFPDMTPSLDKAEFVFKLNLMSSREVQELAENPGFDRSEIIKLLKEDPDLGELKVNLAYRNNNLDRVEPTSGRYAVWRYTGSLDKKDMECLAQKFPDLKDDLDTVGFNAEDDLPVIPMVDMWWSQGHPLKARIRPIEKDFRVPYYVFSPFPADDTVFGYGIPYLTRDSQRVVDAAWQITLHNASVSAGPIIVTRAGKIEPRDRSYEFKGPKVMEITDPDISMADAINVLNIPNNAEQALEILDKAMQILDDEAMTPAIMQGDATESVPTSSGLAMLFNAASIVMRRAASCADDEVFGPIVRRMYWWNMLYNKRQDIKGDYDVVPLGQTKMLVKDVQVQHLQAFMQQSMNPTLAPYINMPEALKLWANLLELPTEKILNDFATVQQQQSQQPDPQAQLAQAKVAQITAQADELKTRSGVNLAKAQAHATGQPGMTPEEHDLQTQDIQVRREEAQASVESNQLKLQAELHKIDAVKQKAQDDNITKLSVSHGKNLVDLHKEGMRARLSAADIAQRDRHHEHARADARDAANQPSEGG